MKEMKYLAAILVVLLLHSCNSELKSRKELESLLNSEQTERYVAGIACMRYISYPESDYRYSKKLVKKLLSLGFFAESISAVDVLLNRFPQDPELYYLHGLGYHNLLQYELAMESFSQAEKMQPDNKNILNQGSSVQKEEKVWNEIDSLNQLLINTSDTYDILLNRAELFFSIKQYDAVLYDLGAVSKIGSANDSLYFTSTISSLNQGGGNNSVEILTDMIEHFREMKDLH